MAAARPESTSCWGHTLGSTNSSCTMLSPTCTLLRFMPAAKKNSALCRRPDTVKSCTVSETPQGRRQNQYVPKYLSQIVTMPVSTATATKDVQLDTAVATILAEDDHTTSGFGSTSAKCDTTSNQHTDNNQRKIRSMHRSKYKSTPTETSGQTLLGIRNDHCKHGLHNSHAQSARNHKRFSRKIVLCHICVKFANPSLNNHPIHLWVLGPFR